MAKKPISLTEDRISTVMLRFALPFLGANVLQAVYGAVDLLIIGRFCNAAAISGVATGSQVMMTLLGLILGISTGSTVLLGQSIGAKDEKKAGGAVASAATLFAIVAVILTPLIIIFSRSMLQLMHIPAEAESEAMHYLVTCACGIPFILSYNILGGMFRASGNSKTPMIFAFFSNCVNVISDLILVGGFHMGAGGAALATVFSQITSVVISALYIRKKGFPFKFDKASCKPNLKSMGFILKVGIPLALQELLVNISFLLITSIVNVMGVVASAAVGIVEKILGFSMMPPMAFASAVTTMSAQNIGAKKPERALQSLRWGISYALIFGIALCAIANLWPTALPSIFAKDADVCYMAGTYLRSYSVDNILICIVFLMNSYFNGCGKSMISFVHSMVATFGVRVPLCRIVQPYCVGTLTPMGWCMPAASFASLIVCSIYFLWLRKKGIGRDTGEPAEELSA